jgi:hypothetical protein
MRSPISEIGTELILLSIMSLMSREELVSYLEAKGLLPLYFPILMERLRRRITEHKP